MEDSSSEYEATLVTLNAEAIKSYLDELEDTLIINKEQKDLVAFLRSNNHDVSQLDLSQKEVLMNMFPQITGCEPTGYCLPDVSSCPPWGNSTPV